jgi:hypothetical protein
MMFHLTNSMFKSAIPNMNDVLKKNPDLVKNMVEAVQNNGQQPDTTAAAGTGRREMKGPGIDLSSMMGGMGMMPPPPMNTSNKTTTHLESLGEEDDEDDDDDDISDIVSISGESTGGELRDVSIKPGGRKRRSRPKKKEISL